MDQPNCSCHDDWHWAVKDHAVVVYEILSKYRKKAWQGDYENMISDGYEALWRGLQAYDPSKGMTLKGYLLTMVSQRVTDGFRSRYGRQEHVRRQRWVIHNTFPLEEAHDVSTDFEWDAEVIRFTQGEVEFVLSQAARIDPLLPRALYYRSENFAWPEIAEILGKTLGQMSYWQNKFNKVLLAQGYQTKRYSGSRR